MQELLAHLDEPHIARQLSIKLGVLSVLARMGPAFACNIGPVSFDNFDSLIKQLVQSVGGDEKSVYLIFNNY